MKVISVLVLYSFGFVASTLSQETIPSIIVKISTLIQDLKLVDSQTDIYHFKSYQQINFQESRTNNGGLIFHLYFKEKKWVLKVLDKFGREILAYHHDLDLGYFPPCLDYGGWIKDFDQENSVCEGAVLEILDSENGGCVRF